MPQLTEHERSQIKHKALMSWRALNAYLTNAGVKQCERLLEIEKEGLDRMRFHKRIHSRLNKVRADEERERFAKEHAARQESKK